MKTFKQVQETFEKGNRLCKVVINSQEEEELVYWLDIRHGMITHTVWGWDSNRQPLFYNNEVDFYKAVKRILRKQK